MNLTRLLSLFLLLITPLSSFAENKSEPFKPCDLLEASKNKHKEKNKKNPPIVLQPPPVIPHTINYDQQLQNYVQNYQEWLKRAGEKESSIPPTFKNVPEVINSFREAAQQYQTAAQAIREALSITHHFINQADVDKQIHSAALNCDTQAQKCLQKAAEWPNKVLAKQKECHEEIKRLKNEGATFEKQELWHSCQETYKQLAFIQKKLIENGEADLLDDLTFFHKKIAELESIKDNRHLTNKLTSLSQKELKEKELLCRDHFFHDVKSDDVVHCAAIPLDGQGAALYTQQFYRYLIQRETSSKNLQIKVLENNEVIHEESIIIPTEGILWEEHLTSDHMLLIPKTSLKSKFGLDLRLTCVYDPYNPFSVIVAAKGSSTNYDFSFFLDDQPLCDLHFISEPPWQLEVLKKPTPNKIQAPFSSTLLPNLISEKDKSISNPPISYPILDQFVKDLKSDPIALCQYVHNEIELSDLFLSKEGNIFQAPAIFKNPLRTFLEQKGSAWEQCMLLVYLLEKAGFQAQYIEGLCSLPASYIEQLLFLQLPNEEEALLNYPGVLFSDGQNRHTLFPWMKDVHTSEGHDVYSLMPEEYGNAERWLKQYLCNDENILKHIASDGDDTVGVLFPRFVEEHLKKQALSLDDVGIHRRILKKQFSSWQDFPSPTIKGNLTSFSNLPDSLFMKIKTVFYSEQKRDKRIETPWLDFASISCETQAIYFTPEENGHQLNCRFSNDWENPLTLPLNDSDKSIIIEVHLIRFRSGISKSESKIFSIVKGTCAALCFESGNSNAKLTSFFAEQYNSQISPEKKFNAYLSFIGASYFEKCSRSSKQLATLHKISPLSYFFVGLSKLAPDNNSAGELRFPQVDMQQLVTYQNDQSIFSPYKETQSAIKQYNILSIADISSNEHQVLREFYNDPHAISTVKLLQIAHQNHTRKGLSGPGFLQFTSKSFLDADQNPEMARLIHFSHMGNIDLKEIKIAAKDQWKNLYSLFDKEDSAYTYAYMTPGPVSSQDGYGLLPPSYTGIGTLAHSSLTYGAWISDGSRIMNGGFGSRLPSDFTQKITAQDWKLTSNGNKYSLFTPKHAPVFNGISTPQLVANNGLPFFQTNEESNQPFMWMNNGLWISPSSTEWKSDLRLAFKNILDSVGDPVDVITGAFYIDEVDLSLPGAFPLEIRRNYNSQSPLPGLFGFGWKLSLNPILFEEEDKLFASEQDGSVIVYRRDNQRNCWTILPEDNPALKNSNTKGIGGNANPFHAYIKKDQSDHILYGTDGSKRIFKNKLLQSWSDHAGNTLTFFYDKENLIRIENSSGGVLCFEYNYGGKISEAYTKDGRRITYSYDFQGNLSSVTLPNSATITYEYDRSHKIIRETKPHGRVLENVYQDDKVIEQRSPVGPQQQMMTSAMFSYEDGLTVVIDPLGGRTEYKIYQNQIYKITDPEGHQTLQTWFLDKNSYFDAETEKIVACSEIGAYQSSLKSSTDKRGLTTNYQYDSNGNPQAISLTGKDLTGDGASQVSKQFIYNTHNLCIEEKALNAKTKTIYDATLPYLPKRIEKYVDETLVSFMDLEYTKKGLIKKTNHCDAITLIEYDNRNFPTEKIQKTGTDDPDVVTSYRYNNQGQCLDLITADSIQHNEYDIMGNRISSTISLPDGKILSKTYAGYDLNNELVWKQGDNIHDTIFLDYNAAGLLKSSRMNLSQINGSKTQSAGVAYTLYEYDAFGSLIEKVDPLGNCTYCNYDSMGRMINTSQNGLTSQFTYESGGLIASMTNPNGATVFREYTTNGLLKNESYPDGTFSKRIYDLLGRLIQEEKNGITAKIEYNDATLEETRAEGELSEVRQFDPRGNLIAFTDKAGYKWTKTYDALNRLTSDCSPNGETTTWSYQSDTIICSLPNGEKKVQRHEAGSLVESQTFAADGTLLSKTSQHKDPSQNITEEVIGDITMTTWTNTLGLPIRIQQGNKVASHYYDANGNCITSIDAEGNITKQEFDPSGRLIRKTLPDGAIITYDYDAASNLIAYHMPGELSWKANYDAVGHKISEWQESAGKKFQKWEYHYKNGHLVQSIDPLNRPHHYDYDPHFRLIQESVGKYTRTYFYDARNLLKSVTESGEDTSKIERSYDESGRLIQEDISLNGIVQQNSQQSWTPSSRSLQIGEHKRDFEYQGGRLKSLSSKELNLSYDYATSGSLVKKTTPFSTLTIAYNDSALPVTIETILPGSKYNETLQWSTLGKLAAYDATYPNTDPQTFNYSSRGHLQSTEEATYAFDHDLPGRGIRTLAPQLEVPSNGLDELGRITKETTDKTSYTTAYDEMGQVVIHGKEQLSWDPWGRLIAVKSDQYEWTASYDAFGRRLQTNYTTLNDYYLFKTKSKPIITKSFYDPEHEFQEIGISYGENTFWKLYGSTSCEAISDSTGNSVVLHHDMRNNLKAVISSEEIVWNQDYPTPYGPRGPPKSLNPDLLAYAQSLTWQSRRVDPTGLIWLGARYYDPQGARFLSPDPISHPACLDLYAYANGDPINNVDLDGRFSSPHYNTLGSTSITKLGLPTVYYADSIEELRTPHNRSRLYDLSDLGKPDLPNGKTIGFANGIYNSFEDARESAKYLSKLSGGYNIHGTYGANQGAFSDVFSCQLALNYIDTGRVKPLHDSWDEHFKKNPDAYYLHICHSRGAIDTRNALLMYSEEKRKKIIVVAIAPAAYIYEETCANVIHYRVSAEYDWVPYIDKAGAERVKHTIVDLPHHQNAWCIDHGLMSLTYKKIIEARIIEYIESRK